MGSASGSRLGTCPFLGINLFYSFKSFGAVKPFTGSQLPGLLKSPGLMICAEDAFNHQSWQLSIPAILFRSLRSVLRASLFAVSDSGRIQCASHHVIAHAGKVLDAASTDKHDRVLLQVVSNTRDVRGHFDAVGQTHAGYFAQG